MKRLQNQGLNIHLFNSVLGYDFWFSFLVTFASCSTAGVVIFLRDAIDFSLRYSLRVQPVSLKNWQNDFEMFILIKKKSNNLAFEW